jgi:PKD repeat protein
MMRALKSVLAIAAFLLALCHGAPAYAQLFAAPSCGSIRWDWRPATANPQNFSAQVHFKPAGAPPQNYVLGPAIVQDPDDAGLRGVIPNLQPNTAYDIRLTLNSTPPEVAEILGTTTVESKFIPTFESIGMCWAPAGKGPTTIASVRFKPAGAPDSQYRQGLDLWYDARTNLLQNAEYRGSLVELQPGTAYDIELKLSTGLTRTIPNAVRTWSETFPIGNTITVQPGTTRLIIDASQSGTANGYTLVTAPPGQNVIDQATLPTSANHDGCIIVRQGTHHVIIRGLQLKNCQRDGIFIERQFSPVLNVQTRDIVIEDNEIFGWGAFGQDNTQNLANNDGAILCNYARETGDPIRPDRIIIQRNTIRDPRFGSNPWGPQSNPVHPWGPQPVVFTRCGTNHVIRYNDIYSKPNPQTGVINHFMDGIGGGDNFSTRGFPSADSDIYGNRISQVYDDAIESEGGNRNVRIWKNYLDRTMVAIGNAHTSVGPFYVWRNVSNDMSRLADPAASADSGGRGSFVKTVSGNQNLSLNGGRAYFFHNTVLQPPNPASGALYTLGAGHVLGDACDGCGSPPFHNFVSRNNIWQTHKVPHIDGQGKYESILGNCDPAQGRPCDADFDLYNGRIFSAGANAEANGWGNPAVGDVNSAPTFLFANPATGGRYPANLPGQTNGWSGDFRLAASSLGTTNVPLVPNFNDLDGTRHVGAQPPSQDVMRFGVGAAPPPGTVGPTALLNASPLSGTAPLTVTFDASGSTQGSAPISAYSIDFGDKTSGTGAKQSHTYGALGSYTAILTVTDGNTLQSTDSKTIQVTTAGGTEPPVFSGASAFRLFVSAGPGLIINRAASERIDFSVAAADARALSKVRFFLNDVHKLTDTAAPFQFSWIPAPSDPAGNYILIAEATDTAGNVAIESRSLTLLASTCSIFVSAASAVQGQPINVQGVCSASQTVEKMEFFVDDVLQSPYRDGKPPYSWTMDSSAFAVGTRALRVRGVQGTIALGEASASVQILAAPLTLTFSPGPVVHRTEDLSVTVSATDGRALKQVDFYVNSQFSAGENMAPFSFVWVGSGQFARPDGLGRHQLYVQATDMQGNVLTATRDLYVLSDTCNVLLGTSKYGVSSHDTVLVGPHTVIQGQLLPVQGLCSASQNVQQIEFYVNAVQQTIDVSAPYGLAISTASFAPGPYTVSITARLAGGGVVNHSIPIEIVAPRP